MVTYMVFSRVLVFDFGFVHRAAEIAWGLRDRLGLAKDGMRTEQLLRSADELLRGGVVITL